MDPPADEGEADAADGSQPPDAVGLLSPQKTARGRSKDKVIVLDRFEARTVIGAIIVLDLLSLGFEVDAWMSNATGYKCVFNSLYVAEIALRVRTHGLQMFVPKELVQKDGYRTKVRSAVLNVFVLSLALLGVADTLASAGSWSSCRNAFMYLRLLRGVRIFILFEVLTRFIEALLGMTHQLAWIFSLIALATYISAVFFTLYTESEELLRAEEIYTDVLTSAFRLFQVTTTDNWYHLARPLIKSHWAWAIFFVVFIAFTSWIMTSLVTARLSEDIMRATQMQDEQAARLLEKKKKDFALFLKDCFRHADSDGNGLLDKQEFLALIKQELVTRKIEELGVIIQFEELRDTFDMLDVTETGELSIDQFIDGLSQMQHNLGIKQIASLNYGLQKVYIKLQKQLRATATESDQKYCQLLDKVQALERQALQKDELDARLDLLDRTLAALMDDFNDAPGWSVTRSFAY